MTVKRRYPYSASFEKIFERLTSEDFLRRKYEGTGSRNVVFTECGQDGDIFRIGWRREVPLHVPGFAKKFLSEWTKTEEIMEWSREEDGSAHGDYQCRVGSLPGVLEGSFDLYPEGSACLEEIEMEARIGIPLVGGKLAKVVENDAANQLDGENDFTLRELAAG